MESSTNYKGWRAIKILVVLALIIFAGWSFYSYLHVSQKMEMLQTQEGQQQLAQEEIDQLVAKIGKLMILPADEVPTVATISDVEALTKDQPFFTGAQDGDRLLVYVKAQKAIVYRPSENIIVNVGSLVVNDKK
jgi:hypothetical protein